MSRRCEKGWHCCFQVAEIGIIFGAGQVVEGVRERFSPMDGMIGEEHGPVIYAVVRHHASNSHPMVRERFGQS